MKIKIIFIFILFFLNNLFAKNKINIVKVENEIITTYELKIKFNIINFS